MVSRTVAECPVTGRVLSRGALTNFVRGVFALSFLMLPFAVSSAQAQTRSPIYSDYNTFLDADNFLELINAGTETTDVSVQVYDITGAVIDDASYRLQPSEQRDIDIRAIVDQDDTYGVVKVSFDASDPDKSIIGRMSIYRLDPDDVTNYSFAYAKELLRPVRDITYVTSNSYDPQGFGNLVPNWAQVTNLDSQSRKIVHRLYNISGTVVAEQELTLAPFERRDVAAGHQFGQSVYLNEFLPESDDFDYSATVTRYGPGTAPGSYIFAIPLNAKEGIDSEQFVPIVNKESFTADSCFTQTNWLEVVNTTSDTVRADIDYYSNTGQLLDSDSTNIAPHAQAHFNASALLESSNRTAGVARVSANISDSLLVQSSVYYHHCEENRLETAYAVEGLLPRTLPLTSSFNRFLTMQNELQTIATRTVNQTATVTLTSGGVELSSTPSDFTRISLLEQVLNESFGTQPNTYGVISLDSTASEGVVGVNLRYRKTGPRQREFDYVVPIPLR